MEEITLEMIKAQELTKLEEQVKKYAKNLSNPGVEITLYQTVIKLTLMESIRYEA